MAMSAKLQLKQSQSLVMTPQLLQSIKLLQYSNVELQEFVQGELEKNPILEMEQANNEHSPRENDEPSREQVDKDAPVEDISKLVSEELPVEQANPESRLDASMENVFDAGTSGADANKSSEADNSDWKPDSTSVGSGNTLGATSSYNIEAFIAEKVDLRQSLIEQTNLLFIGNSERGIAEEIIGSMDDDGFMRRDLLEIAEARSATLAEANAVLQSIHSFDPPGICARDLKESLAIQLRLKNRLDPMMEKLLANLDLLAKHDFSGLQKVCEASRSDLLEMISEIRALNPRPASQLDVEPVSELIPDVFVKLRNDGGWAIELNSDALPKVLVNRTYHAEISKSVVSDQDKEFMVDCLHSANWLVRSLDQRAQTILKVATEIVKQQDMFFAEGVEHLKPLNLKTVAENIKMHESTVSRVTSNKYIMTERGIFEMKYFFNSAISATDGGDLHSAVTVRHKIKALIEAETIDKILSDDTIVDLLKDEGVEIARRTVAKYREFMKIPSSVQRRREKKSLELAS
ncbi:MAG: RNA polymerase factor sigma-54 [Rhizobiaceae bacterium]